MLWTMEGLHNEMEPRKRSTCDSPGRRLGIFVDLARWTWTDTGDAGTSALCEKHLDGNQKGPIESATHQEVVQPPVTQVE